MSILLASPGYLRDDAFAAVLGVRRGRGLGGRQAELYAPLVNLLWLPGRDYHNDDFAAYRQLVAAARRSPYGMSRALTALNGGQHALARAGWAAHPLAGWALRALTNAIAVAYVHGQRGELDRLLSDLGLDQMGGASSALQGGVKPTGEGHGRR